MNRLTPTYHRLRDNEVRAYPANHTLRFGPPAVTRFRLERYGSVCVYRATPDLVYLQLHENGDGDYPLRHRRSAVEFSSAGLFVAVRGLSGRYPLTRDVAGLLKISVSGRGR